VTVELHHRLFILGVSREPTAAGVWTRLARGRFPSPPGGGQGEGAPQARLAGRELALLGPEDLLLGLAVHAARHSFAAGLRDLVDLGRVVRLLRDPEPPGGRRLDWAALLALPEAELAAPYLFDGLALAGHYVGAPVPPEVLGELWGRMSARQRRASRRIRRGFFRRPRTGLRAAAERLLEKPEPLAALRRFLRPPPAEVAQKLGRGGVLARLWHPFWTLGRLAGWWTARGEPGERPGRRHARR
jgi:hypothetical protein